MLERPITVVETAPFVRHAATVWDDGEREAFIDFIARNPDAGDIIPATGGVRKVRWGRAGSGKRGGVRVIYFYYDEDVPLFLLTLYAKASQGDMSPDEKRDIATAAEALKQRFRKDK